MYRQNDKYALKNSGKRLFGKYTAMLLAAALFFGVIGDVRRVHAADVSGGNVADFREVINAYGNQYRFDDYLRDHQFAAYPNAEIYIEASDYSRTDFMDAVVIENFEGMEGKSLWTDEDGLVEYEFYVEQAGLYNLSVLYFNVRGKNADIQRSVFIDGKLPFVEAITVEFRRSWVNQLDYIQVDNRGNDLRPIQVEEFIWQESPVEDPMGSYMEPFCFYLSEGTHTLTIISQREPMVIRSLKFHQIPRVPKYAELSAAYASLPKPSGISEKTEAQDAVRKSSPMLYPTGDNSSPALTPYSAKEIKINNIGGRNWESAGQWIEWEINVPADGLYKIAMNVKQNYIRGTNVYRKIYIDGAVPFEEMKAVPFGFESSWRVDTLGGEENPYLFYLTKGKHTLRMEVVLGEYATFMREMMETVYHLNTLYRQLIMITGIAPDSFRDYQINRRLPHLHGELTAERQKLDRMYEGLVQLSGGQGDRDAVVRTTAVLLGRIYKNVEEITKRLSMFKTNIGSLSTWMMQVREMNLAVESIYVLSADAPKPKSNNGFWAKLWHELSTLFYSFIIDYNAIGNVSKDGDSRMITVWVGTGRDQANTIKALIDEDFTVNTDININLMLVDMGTLLPATLSGQGPSVAMMIGNDLPMNYGMRGAVTNLSQFADFEEVSRRFMPSAMVPYRFRDKVFALPETQSFNMLFYRKDIMHELGLELPKTWDDVKDMLAVLSKNHMEFGIPIEGSIEGTYTMFLYQAGGRLYAPDGLKSELDSDISISTFREFTRFFTDYRQPRTYDFANRFRNGELPVAVADYTVYNMLQVFAPEIRGLWAFTNVPGTLKADGTIDHSVATGGIGTVIMERSPDKEAAWEYIKWWTSGDVQTKYGFGMEALMGPAARYNSANQEAFSRLPWPVNDYNNLLSQFQWARGIPQVPGGYFTPRQLNNAFYRVVENTTVGPREALTDFTRLINEEISNKRKEFGLNYLQH